MKLSEAEALDYKELIGEEKEKSLIVKIKEFIIKVLNYEKPN